MLIYVLSDLITGNEWAGVQHTAKDLIGSMVGTHVRLQVGAAVHPVHSNAQN